MVAWGIHWKRVAVLAAFAVVSTTAFAQDMSMEVQSGGASGELGVSESSWDWIPVNGVWVWGPVAVGPVVTVAVPVQQVQATDLSGTSANPSQQTFDSQDWVNSWNAFQSQSWSNAPVQSFDAQDNWANSYNQFQQQAWSNAPVQNFSSQGFVGGNPSFGQQAWRPNQRW